jgi:hypothetical protein
MTKSPGGEPRLVPGEACYAGREKSQIASAAATHLGRGPDRQIPRVLFASLLFFPPLGSLVRMKITTR